MQAEEMKARSLDLFNKHLHCSQVLAMVGLEKLEMNDPSVIKAMGSFGGGIGGCGCTCGALIGAVSVIGSLYSRGSLEEKENPRMWAATKEVLKNFQELTKEYGGINCSDIARIDWMNKDEVGNFYGKPDSRRQHCLRVVGETAYALGLLLDKEATRTAEKKAAGK